MPQVRIIQFERDNTRRPVHALLGVISILKPTTNIIPKGFFFRRFWSGDKIVPRNFEKKLHKLFEHYLLLYA